MSKKHEVLNQQKRTAQTRNAILKSAACQFRNRGYAATTLRDIAAASNMKAGSIYYHFGSKLDILDEVLDCGLRDIHDGVRKVIDTVNGSDDYRVKITDAIHAHLTLLLTLSEFTSANIRIYGQLPEDVRKRHQPLRHDYARIWDRLLKEAQRAGQIRADIKIVPLRQFILGALNWTVEWFDAEKYSVDVLADRAAKVILDGILIDESIGDPLRLASSTKTLVKADITRKKSDRTHRVILRAAATLFQKQGYASTTLRDIAAAADMKAGSIYYHFDTKTEILNEVLDRGLRDVFDGVATVIKLHENDKDYRAKFAAAVHEHLTQLLVSSEFTSANLRIYGQLTQELRKRHQPLRHAYSLLWDDLLAEAKSAGKLRQDVDIVPLRQFILGALNWTVEWFDSEKYSVDMLAERCARLLLDGICVKLK